MRTRHWALAILIGSLLATTSTVRTEPMPQPAQITRASIATGTPNTLVYNAASTGVMTDLPAITASRILRSDANGLPVANAALTNSRLVTTDGSGNLASNAALTANRILLSDASGFVTVNAALANNRVVLSDSSGFLAVNAALTGNRALASDSGGGLTSSAVTDTELSRLTGLTANAQTQLNARAPDDYGYTFSNTTSMADPGTGVFRLNNATPASVTAIAISDTDLVGTDRDANLDSIGSVFYIEFVPLTAAVVRARYFVASSTDNGTWHQLTVTYVDGYNSFSNNAPCTMRIRGPVRPLDIAAFTASKVALTNGSGILTTSTLSSANLENVAHTVSDTATVDLTLSTGTLSADVIRNALTFSTYGFNAANQNISAATDTNISGLSALNLPVLTSVNTRVYEVTGAVTFTNTAGASNLIQVKLWNGVNGTVGDTHLYTTSMVMASGALGTTVPIGPFRFTPASSGLTKFGISVVCGGTCTVTGLAPNHSTVLNREIP